MTVTCSTHCTAAGTPSWWADTQCPVACCTLARRLTHIGLHHLSTTERHTCPSPRSLYLARGSCFESSYGLVDIGPPAGMRLCLVVPAGQQHWGRIHGPDQIAGLLDRNSAVDMCVTHVTCAVSTLPCCMACYTALLGQPGAATSIACVCEWQVQPWRKQCCRSHSLWWVG